MKHFEDLWNEAEGLVEPKPLGKRIEEIKNLLDKVQNSPEDFGNILFQLSGLSRDLNVNVYSALELSINDVKIETYD
jgi:hypothetical protein